MWHFQGRRLMRIPYHYSFFQELEHAQLKVKTLENDLALEVHRREQVLCVCVRAIKA